MASLSEIRHRYRDKSVDEIIDMLSSEFTKPSKDLAFRELWRETLTEISVCNYRPRIDLGSDASKTQLEAIAKWLLFMVRLIALYWFSDGGAITRKSAYTNLAKSDWLISALLFGDDEQLKFGLKNSAITLTLNKKIHLNLDDKQAKFSEMVRETFNNFSDNYVKRAEEHFVEPILTTLNEQLEALELDYVAEQMATVQSNLVGEIASQKQSNHYMQTRLKPLIESKTSDDFIGMLGWIGLIVLFFNFMGIFEILGVLDEFFGRNIEFFGNKLLASSIFGFVIAILLYILRTIANKLDDSKLEADSASTQLGSPPEE
jgi:hypothetical protein